MTNAEMWNLLVGFFLPPVLAVVQQSNWRKAFRSAVLFIVACGISIPVVIWQSDDLTWHNWVKAALSILVAAIATYHGFWKPTGVAPTVERKTNAVATTD